MSSSKSASERVLVFALHLTKGTVDSTLPERGPRHFLAAKPHHMIWQKILKYRLHFGRKVGNAQRITTTTIRQAASHLKARLIGTSRQHFQKTSQQAAMQPSPNRRQRDGACRPHFLSCCLCPFPHNRPPPTGVSQPEW